MVPANLRSLFWEIDTDAFEPAQWPEYTIFRVLEWGGTDAVHWMRQLFSREQIERVIRNERRLTRRSANLWAIVYGIPAAEVAALHRPPDPIWRE